MADSLPAALNWHRSRLDAEATIRHGMEIKQ